LGGLCLSCRHRRSNPEEEEANHNKEPNNSPQPKPLFTANIAQEHPVTDDVFLHYEKVEEIGIGSTCTIWTARCIHQPHTGTHDSKPEVTHDSHGGVGAPEEATRVLETPTSLTTQPFHSHTQQAPKNKERLYALKQVAKGELKNPSFLVALSNEIDILRAMDHPNIVRVHEKFVAEDAVYLVTELCVGGDLYARSPYTEGQAAHIVSQMLLALAYMHKRNICHRDLKHENILFTSPRNTASYHIKLIDFGLSRKYLKHQNVMTERVGTLYTMAPEVLRGEYTTQADVWSTGVIAYILLSGKRNIEPFEGKTRQEVMDRIQSGDLSFRGTHWKRISKRAKAFCASLLKVDPSQRLTAVEAQRVDWLDQNQSLYRLSKTKSQLDQAGLFRDMVNSALIQSASEDTKLKKLALMVISYNSNLDEIQQLAGIFNEMDAKNDGTISYSEFRKAFQKQYRKKYNRMEESEIQKIFNSIDVNETGVIDYTEFLAATLEARGKIEIEQIAQAFDRFDVDNTGYISRDNLRSILGHTCRSDAIVNEILGDENDLKQISFEEFLSLFEQEESRRIGKAREDLQKLIKSE